MPGEPKTRSPRLPPRWFVRFFWSAHRDLYRVTAGRIGLWRPNGNRWGAMRLTATGRRTGRPRSVIIGYFEDGPDLVTMAMNGWGDGEPAWWLDLQAHPDAEVRLADGPRLVRAPPGQLPTQPHGRPGPDRGGPRAPPSAPAALPCPSRPGYS
jgi:deazaflavin-dependent oxidoreductase (nitroreductase family)